jgi:hypothetical protein
MENLTKRLGFDENGGRSHRPGAEATIAAYRL